MAQDKSDFGCGGMNYCYWWFFFSKVWPIFFSIVLLSHNMLWWLKFPTKINDLGSCFIKLFSSLSFMGSWDEIYSEQMETILCKFVETTIASKWVLMLILLRQTFLQIRTDTLLEDLSPESCIVLSFSYLVYPVFLLSFFGVIMVGFSLAINRSSLL